MKRKKSLDWSKEWEIGWSPAKFNAARKHPGLPSLIALGRISNLIRFAFDPVVGVKGRTDEFGPPARRRQMINSFFLSCAFVFEAVDAVIPEVNRHFGLDPTYQATIGKVMSNRSWVALVRGPFRDLRRRMTFHCDVERIAESLKHVQMDYYPMVTGKGAVRGAMYYDLADVLAMQEVVGAHPDIGAVDTRLNESAKVIAELLKAISDFLETTVEEKMQARPRQKTSS